MCIRDSSHTYADGKCTACGAEDPNYNPKPTIPSEPDATDKPDDSKGNPQTGDNSNSNFWIVVALVAGAALTGVAFNSRKTNYNR